MYDLARIYALKILEVNELQPDRESAVRMISRIIQSDDDLDVRSHAARASAGFVGVPGALDVATRLVLDSNEDEDTRHNAFFAIERNMPLPEAVAALVRIRDNPEFGADAGRVLGKF